jgi:imidazolonepropionase
MPVCSSALGRCTLQVRALQISISIMSAEVQSAAERGVSATRCDRLWRNARLVTLASSAQLEKPAAASGGADRLGQIEDGVVASKDGVIVFAGARGDLPARLEADEEIDCEGRLITPGFIDCHTHLVYAGDRAHEFERRLNGESYEAIARAGGGIAATVRATRDASEQRLVQEALPRLDALLAEGVTTIEIKSGYGLSLEHERKQLRAARSLAEQRAVSVTTTLLGAHALPPEYAGRADDYVQEVCERMLPALAAEGLIDAVDVFCERIGFSVEQTRRVFEAAAKHGLRVKLHAEQLSNSHGAALAAAHGALSADHLEHLDDAGVDALARAGTSAVLLPGAFYFMRETQLPPLDQLRQRGVPIALATDCNPGTSPLTSILLVLNLATTLFRMTVDECLIGVTSAAAGALGLSDRIGSLVPGKRCDLAIWNVERPAELVYRIGSRPLHARVWSGR